jgi:hypothetical protein
MGHRAAAGGVQPVQYLQLGLPNNNFGSGSFKRITTMTGDPRIMQFGIKYGF